MPKKKKYMPEPVRVIHPTWDELMDRFELEVREGVSVLKISTEEATRRALEQWAAKGYDADRIRLSLVTEKITGSKRKLWWFDPDTNSTFTTRTAGVTKVIV